MYRYMVLGEPIEPMRKPPENGVLEVLRRKAAKMKEVPGGTPISYEEALELRQLLQGTAMHSLSTDYKSMALCFHEEDSNFAFGLQVERNGCRGVIICVQAHLIRHLVFKGKTKEEIQTSERPGSAESFISDEFTSKAHIILWDWPSRSKVIDKSVLHPGGHFRREALISAVCEMLWRAGSEERCCVAFPQDGDPVFTQTGEYRFDGVTERLHLYNFTSHDDLHTFMRKNMDFFETESTSGCLLFVYSMVLSRTIEKVRGDCGSSTWRLFTENEECTQGLINLMLFGRAVHGVSNSDETHDDEGRKLAKPKLGVQCRGSCGFLYWHKDEEDVNRTAVGSMLKTPKHPIWVTQVNGNYGLLFSLNPDLTRDWREEHKFELHYYTGLSTQMNDARLTVDTRWGRKIHIASDTGGEECKPVRVPALEHCIMTKWSGAEIDWNGTMSFI